MLCKVADHRGVLFSVDHRRNDCEVPHLLLVQSSVHGGHSRAHAVAMQRELVHLGLFQDNVDAVVDVAVDIVVKRHVLVCRSRVLPVNQIDVKALAQQALHPALVLLEVKHIIAVYQRVDYEYRGPCGLADHLLVVQ